MIPLGSPVFMFHSNGIHSHHLNWLNCQYRSSLYNLMYSIFISDCYKQSCVLSFYFQSMRLLMKWSCLFVVSVKDNNYHTRVLLKFLFRIFWGISSLRVSVTKMIIRKSPNLYNGDSVFDVHWQRQENQIYFKSIFVIKLRLLLWLY